MLFIHFQNESDLEDVFSLFKIDFKRIGAKASECAEFTKIESAHVQYMHSNNTSTDKNGVFPICVAELIPDFFKKPLNAIL